MHVERLLLEGDTPGQDFGLRVVRFAGTGKARSIYVQAGLHAHELPGMVALDRLMPRLEAAEREGRLAGSVTLVPHANPVGLAQAVFGETLGRFDLSGRLNFNRSFPTQTLGEMAGRPAAERLKATLLGLAAEADVVLDLHCDDEGPIYLYAAESQLDEARRLARALGAAVILTDSSTTAGTFDLVVAARWQAEAEPFRPRFAATVELRGMMDVSADLAETDAQGLYRYLVDLKVIMDDLPNPAPSDPIIGDVDWAELIPTPVAGAVLYEVAVGEWVSAGQCVARVLYEAGVPLHDVLAPAEGYVMTRRDRRVLRQGDDVLKILRHPRPSA